MSSTVKDALWTLFALALLALAVFGVRFAWVTYRHDSKKSGTAEAAENASTDAKGITGIAGSENGMVHARPEGL